MIVDDIRVTIGSANTDKNIFRDSSELNLGVTSTRHARQLRTRLWQEHFGTTKYMQKKPHGRNEHAKKAQQKRCDSLWTWGNRKF